MPPTRACTPRSDPIGHHAVASARSAAFVAVVATGTALIHRIGPPLPLDAGAIHVGHWTTWVHTVGPAAAVMAPVRVGSLVVGVYLALAATLHLAAGLSRSANMVQAVRLVTVPGVRRLLTGVTGAGLAVSLSMGAIAAGPAGAEQPARTTLPGALAAPNHTMRRADVPSPSPSVATHDPDTGGALTPDRPAPHGPSSTERSPGTTTASRPTPVMRRLEAAAPTGPATDSTAPAPPAHAGSQLPTASAPAPVPAASWTIAPGDHLWRVARETLRSVRGGPVTDSDTARYLHRLVAANAGILVVADDPDLVLPGQVFVLPDPVDPH